MAHTSTYTSAQPTVTRVPFSLPHRIVAFVVVLACALPLVVHAQVQEGTCSAPNPIDRPIVRQSGFLRVILYYARNPIVSPEERLRALLPAHIPGARVVERLPARSAGLTEPQVLRIAVPDTSQKFSPPSMESLQYFGRGMSRPEAENMAQATVAYALAIHLPQTRFAEQFSAAHRLVHEIARDTGALIWDDESREAFNVASWKQLRIDTWQDGTPELSRHTTIHLYRHGDYLRAITLGLGKFGLPDLVMQEMAQSDNRAAGLLLNLLAQRLLESPARPRLGAFDLKVAELHDPRLRAQAARESLPGATGDAPLCLYSARAEEGDPDNAILAVGFERAPGNDTHARRFALLSKAFGVGPEQIVRAPSGDTALLEASRRARGRLPQLQARFAQGLAPGEKIMLKARFELPVTPAQAQGKEASAEYMWVEVGRWEAGGKIAGLLMNEPQVVKGLHAGQQVQIAEPDVFDYIHALPDGKREGNETGRILEAREGNAREPAPTREGTVR
jgi:hypothetical protein